jgi:acetylornithine deacetylase/succinyl-diaminopimelate desuccinylase-like protein
VQAGTKANALPSRAVANVNCRVLPDESIDQIEAWLTQVIADPKIVIDRSRDAGHAPTSSIDAETAGAIERAVHSMWPGLPIIPSLMLGSTDSRFLRQIGVPCYGINPLALTEDDATRMHGIDERVPAQSFRTGVELMHRLVMELAGAP